MLLENRGNALPLDRAKIKKLAVIGPNAKGVHLAATPAIPAAAWTCWPASRRAAGAGVEGDYAEGVRITESRAELVRRTRSCMGDPVEEPAAHPGGGRRWRARPTPIVLVIGTNEATSREAWADNHLGDVADLSLMSQQDELADALFDTGKPVVVVLINGRPLAIPRVAERANAILEAWYVGQEGGTAIGEVLFGDVNPGGKLPVTCRATRPAAGLLQPPADVVPPVPRHDARAALGVRPRPELHDVRAVAPVVAPATIGPGGRATVTVEVANTGARAGDEVVQLYIRDVVSSVTRPVKELRGFERVTLAPGEKKTVTFTLGPDALSLINREMQRVVEPGRFEILVGTSSASLKKATLDVTAGR